MPFQFPRARTHPDAHPSRFLNLIAARLFVPAHPPRRTPRLRKFLSYYRPHLPLLAGDLACALLVAATALALPVCAHYVTRSLLELPQVPEAINRIYAMGALMLLMLAVQVL